MNSPRQLSRRSPLLGGWTFIETLVVIGIILILTASVGFMAFKYLDQAKQATARSQIDTLAQALNAYYLDVKAFPTQEQGLKSLWESPGTEGWNGPYISKALPPDPWSHEYLYTTPGPNGLPYEISSLGADGAPEGQGNDADISSAR